MQTLASALTLWVWFVLAWHWFVQRLPQPTMWWNLVIALYATALAWA